MKTRCLWIFGMVVALAVTSCSSPAPAPTQSKQESPTATVALPTKPSSTATVVMPTPTSPPPTPAALEAYWPTKEWRASTPEAQGMDSAVFGKLADAIKQMWSDYDSVLITRHGYVVFEVYQNGTKPETKQDIAEVTMSLISTLFGMAKDEKKVALDQKMLDFFPNAKITTDLERKKLITLETLLAHTTGMDYQPWLDANAIKQAPDLLLYALNVPLVADLGKDVDYNPGSAHILAAVLQQALRTDLLTYANTKLFTPLGITDASWNMAPEKVRRGDTGLMLSARDQAKIGEFYLRQGKWEDLQLVSADWIKQSTCQEIKSQAIAITEQDRMCYNWWFSTEKTPVTRDYAMFLAIGQTGQALIGFPELDIVLVTNGRAKSLNPYVIATTFIVGATKSDKPLPPNPAAYEQLQAKINLFK
jgi:CubicO group peptidase (beta-lactamase class C family)